MPQIRSRRLLQGLVTLACLPLCALPSGCAAVGDSATDDASLGASAQAVSAATVYELSFNVAGTFSLKAGDIVRLKGFPTGWSYTTVEVNLDGAPAQLDLTLSEAGNSYFVTGWNDKITFPYRGGGSQDLVVAKGAGDSRVTFWVSSATPMTPDVTGPGVVATNKIGFVGDGAVEMKKKMHAKALVAIGNHLPDGRLQNLINVSTDADYAAGEWVVRRIGKLDGRIDGLGYVPSQQESDIQGWVEDKAYSMLPFGPSDPGPYDWWSPNVSALIAADDAQIAQAVTALRGTPAAQQNVWEIGNEPNYFPSLTPKEYGQLFNAYAAAVRTRDPDARVAIGALWSPDLMMSPSDFRQMIVDIAKSKALEGKPDIIPNWILREIGEGVGDMLYRRTAWYNGHAAEYLREALKEVPAWLAPIDVSLHAYPLDIRNPVADSTLVAAMNTMITQVAAEVEAFNARSARSKKPQVFVTEYGNVNPGFNVYRARDRMEAMTRELANGGLVEAAFYFKPIGVDRALSSALGVAAPITRLVHEETYAFPYPTPDNPLPCADLNAIGLSLYTLINGAPCSDGALPTRRRGRSFNGDAAHDLAFIEPGDASTHVVPSKGFGFQWSEAQTWLPTQSNGTNKDNYLAGDFNGDGYTDMGYLANDGSFQVRIGDGRSFGSLGSGTWVPSGSFGGSWGRYFVADFTGDGRDDLMFFEPANKTYYLERSTGTSFEWVGIWLNPHVDFNDPARVFIGKFDNDSRADLLSFRGGTQPVTMALALGDKSAAPTRWNTGGVFGDPDDHAYIGDFDGDGRDDLAWANAKRQQIYVAKSRGSSFEAGAGGNWLSTFDMGHAFDKDRFYPADFTGDGVWDLGYLDKDNAFYVHTGSKNERFSSPSTWIPKGGTTFGGSWGTYLPSVSGKRR